MSALIPSKIFKILEMFVSDGLTGQLSLNFKDGRILSCDWKQHSSADTAFCSHCRRPRLDGERNWIARKRQAYCPQCYTDAQET